MEKKWGYLIHLGYNMWYDWNNPEFASRDKAVTDYLRCEKDIWDKIIENLLGFLQTVWRPTTKEYYERHIKAIEAIKKGMAAFYEK